MIRGIDGPLIAKKWNGYTHFHVSVFLLTFITYALMHANRKSFSNVKVLVSEEWSPSHANQSIPEKYPAETWSIRNFFSSSNDKNCKTFLGVLDTVFMVVYAVSLYVNGPLGDRFNLRYMLCGAMFGTAFTIILFACVSEWLEMYNVYWYITFWILNGLFQGPVWPYLLAIMGNWFGKSNRGLILGIWSSNSSVGNILGSLIVAAYVDYGYDIAVLMPAVILTAFTIILFCGLVISPVEVGLPDADHKQDTQDGTEKQLLSKEQSQPDVIMLHKNASTVIVDGNMQSSQPDYVVDYNNEKEMCDISLLDNSSSNNNYNNCAVDSGNERVDDEKNKDVNCRNNNSSTEKRGSFVKPKAVGFIEAVCLPGVAIYSLAYACLKLVNYAFFFWLPYYLNRQFHWSQADVDYLSIWYDVGGIVGAIIGGILSDRLKRAPVMFVMLILGIPSLFIYNHLPGYKLLNAAVLAALGFEIGGVANLLSSAVASDLGRHPKLSGSKSAMATVSSIIDGTGSAGAAIGQLMIPVIEQFLGWNAVFHMLVGCTALTCLGVGRMVYSEFKQCALYESCFGKKKTNNNGNVLVPVATTTTLLQQQRIGEEDEGAIDE